ncbi:putative C6 finger domain protein [Karstenula rhodostoma CBS 690.94]|uniref:C6 finger domain protein n=1 Tax=Karstenula rhodostoma CBS 690.94 TaxID=1392251 RepID=A0A9P4PVW0_9PLEO|nr:putative C6 finger domain protein [Karstenula rhodostoma CBS 690.94]
MQRRSHKKSRGGCLQCKRRHVKCDEQHPNCRLCIVSERTCSFSSQPLNRSAKMDRPPPVSSDEGTLSEASCITQSVSPPDPSHTSRPALYIYPRVTDHPTEHSYPVLDNAINLEHMELLLHAVQAEDLFSLGGDNVARRQYLTMEQILEVSIRYPYVLHQLLAFSARHLASMQSSKAASYLHQAITLQTRAVSLFNASNAPITKETCVPILLFSTVLGHQVLTDTLCRRDATTLNAFLVHFVQCLDTLRGVYVIFMEARPFWQESILEQILSISSSFTSREPVGTRCQRVRELVEASSGLNPDDKEACQVAIRYLQIGFDALLAEHEEKGNRYQMLYLWCILVPKEFIGLLSTKNTEALVVLGHYAILLGYGSAMWQVGDAGLYILGLLRTEKLEWEWTC